MPPKRKTLSAARGPSTQANKRTIESLLPGLAKRRKYAEGTGSNEKKIMDSYCWICHQNGKDVDCKDCQRVYHTDCLDRVSLEFSNDTCPECQLKSHNNVNQSTFLTVEILREILSVAANEFRKNFKNPDKQLFFSRWLPFEVSELVRIVDFDLLEDNIKDESNSYQSLSEITSDIKWIHHNLSILNGVHSPLAKKAEGFVKMFQKEISDIEDCPQCYYSMFVKRRTDDFFIDICDPPHDIIWAWLKGSSPWPAKCLRVESGKAHVRFFGTHDKANIAIGNKKCLAISLTHPTHKKSKLTDANLIPKKREYKIAVDELLIYIDRYERKFCKKFVYYEPGTPYKGEVTKPGHKKRNRSHCNVSTVSNTEENTDGVILIRIGSPLTIERDLNDTNGSPSCSSSQIEVGTSQEEENFGVITSREEDETRDYLATPSPVVTASMVIEVASSDESQNICNNSFTPALYTGQNLCTNTRISQSNFQPQPSCSSTPLANNSNNQLSIHRPQNFLSNNVQEELVSTMNSESQQNISSSSASENVGEDDDVVFVTSCNRNPRMNPTTVLPYVFSSNPDLQSLFREGRYVLDSLFMRCWTAANRVPIAPEIITGFIEENKKITLERNKLQKENEALEREKKELEQNNISLKETLQEKDVKHAEEQGKLKEQVLYHKELKLKTMANAKIVCQGIYTTYARKLKSADFSSSEAKDEELKKVNAESTRKTQLISEATLKLQIMKKENTELKTANHELKATVHELKSAIHELKATDHELKATNNELVDKLEELKKLQREKEGEKEVTGIDDKHLNDLEFNSEVQQPSSSGTEFHDQNHPINVPDNASGSSKESSRSSSSESQDACPRTASHEAEPTDQFCQQTISQEHVKVNTAYDLSQHIAHRERYHAHSPSNFSQNPHRRDRLPTDSRKKQSRSTHHDKI